MTYLLNQNTPLAVALGGVSGKGCFSFNFSLNSISYWERLLAPKAPDITARHY